MQKSLTLRVSVCVVCVSCVFVFCVCVCNFVRYGNLNNEAASVTAGCSATEKKIGRWGRQIRP